MTNSGTDQDAIFDFVIPRGDTGSAQPLDVLSAYSTPAKPGTTGTQLIFDQTATSYGSAISHANGSAQITINEPGVYAVAFHTVLAPMAGVTFPLPISLVLEQDGAALPEAASQHTFHTSADSANVAFSTPITVSSVPTVLTVRASGGEFLYSDSAMSVYRLGDVPA